VGQDLEALSHGRRAGRTGHREALRTIPRTFATLLTGPQLLDALAGVDDAIEDQAAD